MLDPQIEVLDYSTDGRERDMRKVIITFYGTRAEAENLARQIEHEILNRHPASGG